MTLNFHHLCGLCIRTPMEGLCCWSSFKPSISVAVLIVFCVQSTEFSILLFSSNSHYQVLNGMFAFLIKHFGHFLRLHILKSTYFLKLLCHTIYMSTLPNAVEALEGFKSPWSSLGCNRKYLVPTTYGYGRKMWWWNHYALSDDKWFMNMFNYLCFI